MPRLHGRIKRVVVSYKTPNALKAVLHDICRIAFLFLIELQKRCLPPQKATDIFFISVLII